MRLFEADWQRLLVMFQQIKETAPIRAVFFIRNHWREKISQHIAVVGELPTPIYSIAKSFTYLKYEFYLFPFFLLQSRHSI